MAKPTISEKVPEKEIAADEVAKILDPKSDNMVAKPTISEKIPEKEIVADEVAGSLLPKSEHTPIENKTEIAKADIESADKVGHEEKNTVEERTISDTKYEPGLTISETNLVGKKSANSTEEKEPIVVVASKDGVKIVQSRTGEDQTGVAVDAISYDESGDVALSGRGNPARIVKIYLDNTPVSTVTMDASGQWRTALSEIDAGIYTLRIDELDESGKVSSRLEMPFKRESLQELAAYLSVVDEPARVNVVTVQPGNTLWAIARERYGRGILYVRVFENNKDKIRNPDLIYPGQVFALPDD